MRIGELAWEERVDVVGFALRESDTRRGFGGGLDGGSLCRDIDPARTFEVSMWLSLAAAIGGMLA